MRTYTSLSAIQFDIQDEITGVLAGVYAYPLGKAPCRFYSVGDHYIVNGKLMVLDDIIAGAKVDSAALTLAFSLNLYHAVQNGDQCNIYISILTTYKDYVFDSREVSDFYDSN